jgi:tRNA(Ile)-lysidine synthase
MALANKQTGRQITLQSGVVAKRNFDHLWIGRRKEEQDNLYAEIKSFPFEFVLPETGKKLVLMVKNRGELEENIPKSTYTKWFDYDKIKKVISVRTATAEDEIAVYADGRKKKVADVFAEAKIPKEQRKTIPVLAEGSRVLWIPEIRGSEGYHVTKETKQVLIAEIYGGNKNGR